MVNSKTIEEKEKELSTGLMAGSTSVHGVEVNSTASVSTIIKMVKRRKVNGTKGRKSDG